MPTYNLTLFNAISPCHRDTCFITLECLFTDFYTSSRALAHGNATCHIMAESQVIDLKHLCLNFSP